MSAPTRGLYEVLITEALEAQLVQLADRLVAVRGQLRAAEAADRIAMHLGRVVERAIAIIDEDQRPKVGVDLARRLIDEVIRRLPNAVALGVERPAEIAQVLRSVVGRLPDGSWALTAQGIAWIKQDRELSDR